MSVWYVVDKGEVVFSKQQVNLLKAKGHEVERCDWVRRNVVLRGEWYVFYDEVGMEVGRSQSYKEAIRLLIKYARSKDM